MAGTRVNCTDAAKVFKILSSTSHEVEVPEEYHDKFVVVSSHFSALIPANCFHPQVNNTTLHIEFDDCFVESISIGYLRK